MQNFSVRIVCFLFMFSEKILIQLCVTMFAMKNNKDLKIIIVKLNQKSPDLIRTFYFNVNV